MQINNKVKQKLLGYKEKDKKLVLSTLDKNKIPSSKKYKEKTKKENKSIFSCPFCGTEIPFIECSDSNKYSNFFFKDRAKECSLCHAQEVEHCPACNQTTWVLNGIHKHIEKLCGCGFEGKKL